MDRLTDRRISAQMSLPATSRAMMSEVEIKMRLAYMIAKELAPYINISEEIVDGMMMAQHPNDRMHYLRTSILIVPEEAESPIRDPKQGSLFE